MLICDETVNKGSKFFAEKRCSNRATHGTKCKVHTPEAFARRKKLAEARNREKKA